MTGFGLTTERISKKLALAQEILGSSRPRGMEFKVSQLNQMVLLCSLVPHLHWLDQSDLLGRYAMTRERYGVALQHTAYYLLQLPEHVLAGIFESSVPRYGRKPIMNLIAEVLPLFLARSPRTADLCFVMALIYPVIIVFASKPKASAYIQQVSIP